MAFIMPGSEVVLDFSVYNSNDALADAASVEFWWKIGRLGAKNITTPSHVGTGLYQASITPDQGGTIFWRFKATTPNSVQEGQFYVEEDVWDQAATDYQDT